jgi:hypothetical protein
MGRHLVLLEGGKLDGQEVRVSGPFGFLPSPIAVPIFATSRRGKPIDWVIYELVGDESDIHRPSYATGLANSKRHKRYLRYRVTGKYRQGFRVGRPRRTRALFAHQVRIPAGRDRTSTLAQRVG